MLFSSHSGSTKGAYDTYGYGAVADADDTYGAYSAADVQAAGFGASFMQGTDFKCNAAICYAIGPARHVQFQQHQTLLNLFATPVGFPPLVVDGFIGDKTAKAATLVAKAMKASGLPGGDLPVTSTVAGGVTKEQLAALVNDFNLALAAAGPAMQAQRTAAGLPVSPVVAPSTPIPSTPQTQAIVEKAAATTAAKVVEDRKPVKSWVWWLTGGIVAALTVGGVGYVVYRRKARQES